MTAEVVLMNKQAVALAADSAGTIGRKIFNSNNKLFMLSKRYPIGIMVYNSAEIMGYPWETIIKMYRKELGKKSFQTLHEQVENFLEHLRKSSLFDEQAEKIYIETAFDSVATDIRGQIIRYFPEPDEANKELLALHFERIISSIKKASEYNLIECSISDSDKQDILAKYKEFSDNLISKYFEKYGIDQKTKDDIYSIMANTIFCNPIYMGSSGLVFSGFGESEVFPTTESFVISSIIKSKIMMSKPSVNSISVNNSAFIRPFAQRDMVDSFILGIDPNLNSQIKKQVTNMLGSIPNIISDYSQGDKNLLKNTLSDILDKMCKSFLEDMDDYIYNEYMKPISYGVSNLPPDELASMAETLVNLTSFKRKISANQRETVGGPTDVAVITKGDGFIWIRRKHYFNPDKNHHFFKNYFEEE
ncbi:hypothetical protein R83H12_01788 [Fibrobacteria bacterium R8-3-H12]